jgi:hypothetical protein
VSIYDEYRIVINEAQRRLRALTNAMANDRRSTDALGPTLFSMIKPSSRKAQP